MGMTPRTTGIFTGNLQDGKKNGRARLVLSA
jgi:hypothetical protein